MKFKYFKSIERLFKYLQLLREERAFFEPKREIVKKLKLFLEEDIYLRPVLLGEGYSTKYVVIGRKTGRKFFLKVANKYAEKRMKKVEVVRRHFFRERLNREFSVLGELSKYDLSPRPIILGRSFLLMEYVPGDLFSEILKKNPSTEIHNNVLDSIYFIHSKNIVFPDLSPTNIMILRNRIYFFDFEIFFVDGVNWNLQISRALQKYFLRIHQLRCFLENKEKLLRFLNNYNSDIFEEVISRWRKK